MKTLMAKILLIPVCLMSVAQPQLLAAGSQEMRGAVITTQSQPAIAIPVASPASEIKIVSEDKFDSPLSAPSLVSATPVLSKNQSPRSLTLDSVEPPSASGTASPSSPAETDAVKIVSTTVTRDANGEMSINLKIGYDQSQPYIASTIQVWSATSVNGPWTFEGATQSNTILAGTGSDSQFFFFRQKINPREPSKFYKAVTTLKYKPDGPREVQSTINFKEWPGFSTYLLDAKIRIETLGPVDAVGIYIKLARWNTWELVQVIANPKPVEEKAVVFQTAETGWQFKVEPMPQISQNYAVNNASQTYVKPGDLRLYTRNRLPDGTLAPEVPYTIKGLNFWPEMTDAGIEKIKALVRAGVNTIRLENLLPLKSDSLKILDLLYQNGIRVIVNLDWFSASKEYSWYLARQLKNHPAILMWETASVELLEMIKKEDPNHAVSIIMAPADFTGNNVSATSLKKPIPANADIITLDMTNSWFSSTEAITALSRVTSKPFYLANFYFLNTWDDLVFDLSAGQFNGRVIGGVTRADINLNENYAKMQLGYSNQNYFPPLQNQALLSIDLEPYGMSVQVNGGMASDHRDNLRGILVGVLDTKTGTRLRDVLYFDNVAFDATQAIIDFYNSQPDGSVLFFATGSGGGFFDFKTQTRPRPELESFFKGIGSTEIAKSQNLSGWFFAVRKGVGALSEKYLSFMFTDHLKFALTVSLMPTKPITPSVDVTFKSGLTARDVTTLTGLPLVHIMDGSNALSATDFSNGRLRFNYNVTAPETVSGLTVDFDDYATPGREGANLSALSKLTLGLSGSAQSVRVRFQDADGNTGDFKLNQITTAERYWNLDLSLLPANVDRSKIRAIYFFVDPESLAKGQSVGNFSLLLNGVNTLKPVAPKFSPQLTTLTREGMIRLTGTKPAYSAIYLGGKLIVPADSFTYWSTDVGLNEGLNTFSVISKNQQGLSSSTQTIGITRDTIGPVGGPITVGGAIVTQSSDMTLKISASDSSGVDAMQFSFDGGEFTEWEAFSTSKQIKLTSFGVTQIGCRLRDKLGNQSYSEFVVKNVGQAAAEDLSKKLSELLKDSSVPQFRSSDTMNNRRMFLTRLVGLNASDLSILYSHLSQQDQTFVKMLVATTHVIDSFVTDAVLTEMASKPIPLQEFDNKDFTSNLTVLESMKPEQVMAFMGLLSTPVFNRPYSQISWASDSLIVVLLNARWNEFARRSVIGKLLFLQGNYPIPLTGRYYFTYSRAPDIDVTFAPISFTKADLPALQRIQSNGIEPYKTWATQAIASIH